MKCKTRNGRISRLVSTLVGYDDRVTITISTVGQIGNVISRHQQLNLQEEVTKENVTKELLGYGYTKEEIEKWNEYM